MRPARKKLPRAQLEEAAKEAIRAALRAYQFSDEVARTLTLGLEVTHDDYLTWVIYQPRDPASASLDLASARINQYTGEVEAQVFPENLRRAGARHGW